MIPLIIKHFMITRSFWKLRGKHLSLASEKLYNKKGNYFSSTETQKIIKGTSASLSGNLASSGLLIDRQKATGALQFNPPVITLLALD